MGESDRGVLGVEGVLGVRGVEGLEGIYRKSSKRGF